MEEWVQLSEKTFNFARYAQTWFTKGDLDTKRAIFACLGSHLVLKDKKVIITLKKPFQLLVDGLSKVQAELDRLEPIKMPENSFKFNESIAEFPLMSGICNDVGTYWLTTNDRFFIPTLSLETAKIN